MNAIYLDNAASTRVSDEVLALLTEVMRTAWGNPSAQHPQGAAARGHLDTARTRLLAALGDAPGLPRRGSAAAGQRGVDDKGAGDVVWTSGCSEANALAVLAAARTHAGAIVLSTLEHPAVATLADRLAAEGREVRRVAPGRDGVIDADELARVAAGAGVVSLIAVQNELGTVQPIAALIAAIRTVAPDAHVHIDAAQALGKIPLDVGCGADSISIAGHKLHAPKGVGALWLRSTARIEPLWVGGGQQRGLRGGTQDAPSAAGLGLAAERAVAQMPAQRTRWLELASALTTTLEQRGATVRQLVPDHRRAPHILALAVPNTPASALRNVLASRGVYASTGSACADAGAKASPILAAIGLPESDGMVRFSFAHDTTLDDVTRAATILAEAIKSLS
ncbi:MAG: aminotransferase class V-fold PLP-dependent enzyme [Kofleriaceae bacterium]